MRTSRGEQTLYLHNGQPQNDLSTAFETMKAAERAANGPIRSCSAAGSRSADVASTAAAEAGAEAAAAALPSRFDEEESEPAAAATAAAGVNSCCSRAMRLLRARTAACRAATPVAHATRKQLSSV